MLPNQYLLVSIGTEKKGGALLLDTPAFVAGDANLAVPQVMRINENQCLDN